MSERIGALEAMGKSFYFPGAISRARNLGMGATFLVLLILTILPALVGSFHAYKGVGEALALGAENYDQYLPPLELKDGQLIIHGEEPVLFPDPENPVEGMDPYEFLMIFDTSGVYSEFPEEYPAGLLATRDKVFIKQQSGQIQDIELKDIDVALTLDGDYLASHKGGWSLVVALVTALALTLYYAMAKLVHALILAVVGLIAASGRGSLSFGQSLKIGLVALTPAVALQIVRSLLGIEIPFFFVLYLLVGVVYAWLGARGGSGDVPPVTGGSLEEMIQPVEP